MKGTVKWFNAEKGYGFITDESGKDVFVHFSGIEKGRTKTFHFLEQGDEVDFDLGSGDKGDQAEKVCITKKAPKPAKNQKGTSDDEQ